MKTKERYNITLTPKIKKDSEKKAVKEGFKFSTIVEILLRRWLKK